MTKIAVLGGGNLGRALACGWVGAGRFAAGDIRVTRRQDDKLQDLRERGFRTGSDNLAAISDAELVVLSVQPQQLDELLSEIATGLDERRHRVISVVTGVSIAQIRSRIGARVPLVLAMPNTAVAICESMTCLAAEEESADALVEATELFDLVGRTLVIQEEMMAPATALCACGVAFFLRCIRAASQGGIEIGFRLRHISNAGLGEVNPGLDSQVIYVGWVF